MSNIFPKNYESKLTLLETQEAIVLIKSTFQEKLAKSLNLKRVSAPIFVNPNTGLNDNLSGVEKPVSFSLSDGTNLEIVHSLAKWKRYALKEYNVSGLFTDMNAIRKNEELDNLHSIYVDQWDWEKVISEKERNISYLKDIVNRIYKCIYETKEVVSLNYKCFKNKMPKNVFFITSEELLQRYPNLSSSEREYQITKEKGAAFIIGIGEKLSNNLPHDVRASDYDDWKLNGDLLLYDELLDIALEISSMGIRVNKDSLVYQLKEKNELAKLDMPYHKAIINDELPLTIGGGIGQSRLCMFLLEKAHIGEVQSSYWPSKDKEEFLKSNIKFL